jgi:hypothetical protein
MSLANAHVATPHDWRSRHGPCNARQVIVPSFPTNLLISAIGALDRMRELR